MLSERQLAKRVRGWRRAPLRTPPHPARCSQSSQFTTFSREGRGKAPSPVTRHSLDIRHCLCYGRHYLAHSRDAVARHTRLRSKGGAPAGGFAVRTRAALGHHLAGKRTGLRGARWTGQAEAGKTPAQPRPRKRGSGAEPDVVATALASAAVERRKASAPRIWRASTPGSADNGWMRLSALRFPRAFPRDANEL
jgi:hypothetical protein